MCKPDKFSNLIHANNQKNYVQMIVQYWLKNIQKIYRHHFIFTCYYGLVDNYAIRYEVYKY